MQLNTFRGIRSFSSIKSISSFSYALPWDILQGEKGQFEFNDKSYERRRYQMLMPPKKFLVNEPSTESMALAEKILTSPEFMNQSQLIKLKKQEAIEAFKRHPVDTGSSEVQIAVLTERINGLQDHFKKHKKDNHSRRGLMGLIQRRRKLLLYLEDKNPIQYKRVVETYNIREGIMGNRVTNRSEFWLPPRRQQAVAYRPENWKEFKRPTEFYLFKGFKDAKEKIRLEELEKEKARHAKEVLRVEQKKKQDEKLHKTVNNS